MARINIDDSLYQDIRFSKLQKKLDSTETALGALVRAWTLAQKWYLSPSKMIPLSEWKKQDINPAIIEVGLAEVMGDFVRIAGADEQFAWLTQRSQAGRKGGPATTRRRLDITGKSPRRSTSEHVGSKPLPLSLSPSLPLSQSLYKKEERESSGDDAPTPEVIHPLFEIWNRECGVLPKAKGLDPDRRKACDRRWKEIPAEMREKYWTEVVQKIAASNFCNGKTERGWRATFDWLIRPGTHLKAIEGKYDNNSFSKNRTQQISDHHKDQLERIKKGVL